MEMHLFLLNLLSEITQNFRGGSAECLIDLQPSQGPVGGSPRSSTPAPACLRDSPQPPVEPRHGGAPVDRQPGCAGYPPTWYMAAKLSAWQEGDALKTLSLRAPCSEGLTYEMQRSANLRLCGWAPQCKCSGGNATSVSGAWWVQGNSPDDRYTLPPPHTQGARQPGMG